MLFKYAPALCESTFIYTTTAISTGNFIREARITCERGQACMTNVKVIPAIPLRYEGSVYISCWPAIQSRLS